MANPVPAGSDVSARTYKCTNCGNTIGRAQTQSRAGGIPRLVPLRRVANSEPIIGGSSGLRNPCRLTADEKEAPSTRALPW
jgi:hypothetical protein